MSRVIWNDIVIRCCNCGTTKQENGEPVRSSIRWENQYGGAIRVSCPNCKWISEIRKLFNSPDERIRLFNEHHREVPPGMTGTIGISDVGLRGVPGERPSTPLY